MELEKLLLERLNVVNNIIPNIVKADAMFSTPLIIEYLELLSKNDKIDKDFTKTIKNFYLMDSGCILLDNFKEKRYWDIGNFIGYDPSLNIVNLYEKDNTEYNLIDLSDNDSCQDISKSAGLSRIENLKTTISNINTSRLINVDKSQLPSLKILQNGKVDLDYINIDPEPNKTVVLNIMLSPYLMKKENIDVLKEISQNLSNKT
jgi:hypothetical protein